ncbi:MAG: hypothetical protein GY847_28875 [Proteobacteria bacterium]|nr:hypothetical protein [Pseudomonadota bacterium]
MMGGLLKQLKRLHNRELHLQGVGRYTERKAQTKVSHVAKWQNDGTATISPANWVRKTEKSARWKSLLERAIDEWIDGSEFYLDAAGRRMAVSLGRAIDRIDTGRLKLSIRHKIIKGK